MKRILCLLSLLSLIGCNDVHKDKVAKKSVVLKESNVSSFTTLSTFETHPDTFALFFYPEEQELTWSSPLFNDSDSYETKLSNIISNVIGLSNKRDALDSEIFTLNKSITPIDEQMEVENCLLDPTTTICMDLDAKLTDINNQIVAKTNESSDYLLDIQKSVDRDFSNPVNWQKYGVDAKAYEFDINEETNEVKILMPTLGKYANRYSSKDGDIVNIAYFSSQYDSEIKLLSFMLLEKGQFGERTGYIYEFRLEKSSYLDKVRFKGSVVKRLNGDQIQRGVCKFELPVK